MKKFICIILALLLVLPTLPAFADSSESAGVPSVEHAYWQIGSDFNSYTSELPTGFTFTAENKDGASNTASPYARAENNTAIKVNVQDGSPRIDLAGLNRTNDSAYIVDFDVMFDGADNASYKSYGYVSLEFRTTSSNASGYPVINGEAKGTLPIFMYGKILETTDYTHSTWYSVRCVFDGTTDTGAVYVKSENDADYTLVKSYDSFEMNGLKWVRLNPRKYGSSTEANIYLDNVFVYEDKKLWTASLSAEDANGAAVSALPVKGGKLKVKFTRDMGSVSDDAIVIKDSSENPVAFTGSYDSTKREYTIQFADGALAAETTYSVSFKSDLKSADNSTLDSTAAALTFTTDEAVSVSDGAPSVEHAYWQIGSDFNSYTSELPTGFTFTAENKDGASNTASPYTRAENNTAIKVNVQDGSPRIDLAGLSRTNDSAYIVDFDVMLDGSDSATYKGYGFFTLEFRTTSSHEYGYPIVDGNPEASISPLRDGKIFGTDTSYTYDTWYSFRCVFDGTTDTAAMYMKTENDTDYTLVKSYDSFEMNGLKWVRLNPRKYGSSTEANIYFDNVFVYEDKKLWTASLSAEDANGATVSALPVKGGKLKVKFTRDMGSVSDDAIVIKDSSENPVAFTGSYDSTKREYTIQFADGALAAETTYSVSFKSDLKSADNSVLDSTAAALTFTTASGSSGGEVVNPDPDPDPDPDPIKPTPTYSPKITVENADLLDITKPMSGKFSAGSDKFESAEIYVDNKKVHTITADGSNDYSFTADISDMAYLGNATVKVVAKYSDKTETATKDVYLVKMKNDSTAPVFSEYFDTFDGTESSMKLGFTSNNKGTASNAADKFDSSNNVAKFSLTGDGAFLVKSDLGYKKGAVFTLNFDVMFGGDSSGSSSENVAPNSYLRLEIRDYNTKHASGYPYNGTTAMPTIQLFASDGKIYDNPNYSYYANRWYTVKLVFNSITKGVDVYLKEKAGDGDYALIKSYPDLFMDGFKQFRLTMGKRPDFTKGELYLDNIEFYENRANSDWYVKTSYADASGKASDKLPVENGQIKLTFSKDMGAVSADSIEFTNASGDKIAFTGSYDSTNYVYTLTPASKLNYSSEYHIALASGLKSADASAALSTAPIDVMTAGYPVSVKSFKSSATSVTVTVDDSDADGEVLVVAKYDGDKLCDINFATVTAGKKTYTLAMEKSDSSLRTVIYILDSYMNIKDIYSEEGGQSTATLMYPTAGHPRVFLNDEYVAYLKNSKTNGAYAANFKYLLSLANLSLPEITSDSKLSESTSNRLVARALMYALGEVSEEHARKTVEYTIEYVKDPKTSQTDSISRYKDFGINAIQTASLVFDWCYDVMTSAQKTELSGYIKDLMANHTSGSDPKYQPCRPDNVDSWSDIAGKAVGQPLVYNSIAAVAIYDEHPEIYEAIMPKIQGTMADIVRLYGNAGALTDGSIAYTREFYSYYVALLFDRMGHKDIYGDQSKVGYKMLYSRLPYGAYVKQGDDFAQSKYIMGNYTNRSETKSDLAMLSVMCNDPYLRYQYVKENPSAYGWEALLLTTADIEPKLPDTLPLAYYVSEPRSEIMARTSWQDGLDSPAAYGLMSIHNRRSGDHDHSHIGDFQLYYKGPLTMPGGQYQGEGGGYGEPHHLNYYQRTISANCVTVEMPGEKFKRASGYVEANDGGQRAVTSKSGGLVVAEYDEHMADDNLWAVTEAHYIGPNDKTPAFSYIKGDITKAYSSEKMDSYKRSMVFVDTFNEAYPAAMIVFDRVVSANENYKKKWLLQSVTEPTVADNKITIVNTEDGANGKLVNTTLLPEKVNIEKVGEVGKYIVDGKEYPSTTTSSNAYKGGIRLEVSPKDASKEDIFLNAMYVTDADGNAADLPMIKEENDLFVGVTVLDRMVMFSKSARRVNEEFEFDVRSNGYDEMLCLITDIEKGNWCIEGANGKTVVSSDKDGYLLVFSAKPGKYRIYPTSDSADAVNYPEAEKEKIGDYAIKLGSTYTYVKNPNKLNGDVPFFTVADFAERYLDAKTSMADGVLTITVKDGGVIKFTNGSASYTYEKSGTAVDSTMSAKAFIDNGVMYVPATDVASDLGLNATWYPKAKALYFTFN